MKNISAKQFGQDPDHINCLINRKIKQLVILSENESRTIFSSDDKLNVKKITEPVYQTLLVSYNYMALHWIL